MSSGLRGANATQDSRFKDKEALSIKSTKFPKCFDTKVDLRKVNIAVLRPWIAKKVTEMIKFEDDVVVEYVFGMLEDKELPIPDPRKMQVNLLGFMDKHGAAHFTESLWNLLISAQNTVGGVPAEFIEAKKKEIQMQQALGIEPTPDAAQRPQGRERQKDEKPYLPPAGSGARERDRPPRGDRDRGGGRGGREQGWQPPRLQDRGYGARGGDARGGERERDDRGPPRDGGGGGGGYGGRGGFNDRDRDRDRGGYGGPPRGDRGDRDRQGERGEGWQPRRRDDRPPPPRRSRSRSRSRSPPRREAQRRRSPSPSTRAPLPRRDESPLRRRVAADDDDTPPRAASRARGRDSPSPTPPRRTSPISKHPKGRGRAEDTPPPPRRRLSSTPPRRRAAAAAEDDTPPRRARSPTVTPPLRATKRRVESRSRSRTRSKSRSRTRSPARRRRRETSTPPRASRENANGRSADVEPLSAPGNKKGKGSGRVRELEAPLKASKWGAMDDDE